MPKIKDKLEFNHNYDVHGLAGYNPAGTEFYVDKDMPRTFSYEGKEIEIDHFLIVHELIEKTLEDKLGYDYEKAHTIATAAEKKLVESEGISWKEYDSFMQRNIRKCEKESSPNYPSDLEDPTHPGHIQKAASKSLQDRYKKAYKAYVTARDALWKVRDQQLKKGSIQSARFLISNLIKDLD